MKICKDFREVGTALCIEQIVSTNFCGPSVALATAYTYFPFSLKHQKPTVNAHLKMITPSGRYASQGWRVIFTINSVVSDLRMTPSNPIRLADNLLSPERIGIFDYIVDQSLTQSTWKRKDSQSVQVICEMRSIDCCCAFKLPLRQNRGVHWAQALKIKEHNNPVHSKSGGDSSTPPLLGAQATNRSRSNIGMLENRSTARRSQGRTVCRFYSQHSCRRSQAAKFRPI